MTASSGADVIVVGDGLIGLCCARALARVGAEVIVVGTRLPGIASTAAAGLLAPTIEARGGAFQRFAVEARDAFPAFVEQLVADTGHQIDLRLDGILRVALREEELAGLVPSPADGVVTVDPNEIRHLEPALAPTLGGVFHARDGIVDNVALLAALDADCDRRGVGRVDDRARGVRRDPGGGVVVVRASGPDIRGSAVVLACGAWVNEIAGLPRRLQVEPLRGQMLGFPDVGLRRPAYGAGGYVASRFGRMTVAGGTAEAVGFDPGLTEAARAAMTETAQRLASNLRGLAPIAHWSGLRPMTPNGEPILGRDPAMAEVVYACGHSRNGVLLAPQTGAVVADLIRGDLKHPILSVLGPSGPSVEASASSPLPQRRSNHGEDEVTVKS